MRKNQWMLLLIISLIFLSIKVNWAVSQELFIDDFETGPLSEWGNEIGDWTVINGEYNSTTSGWSYSSIPFNDLSNFAIDVDINYAWDAGIFFYSGGPFSNGISLIIGGNGGGGNGLYWHTWVNGSPSGILNPSGYLFPSGSDIHVRLEVDGNLFTAYVNGSTSPATTFTSDLYTNGEIALYSNQPNPQTFDNFLLTTCTSTPVFVGMQYPYDFIQDAYDSITIGTQETIFLQTMDFNENLIFDRDVQVILKGGFNCYFSEPAFSFTSIDSMVIKSGTVNTENIVIKSYSIPIECINDVTLCTTIGDCNAAGGYWWSNHTCMGVPESETVVSADGRIWMDRNLDASQVATSSDDPLAYGGWYQWGREADGHQLPGGVLTSTTSSSDSPGHDDFILTETSPFDWRLPQNDNLWQGVSGTNNPCPAGFRIPTQAEWEAETVSWSSMDAAGAFASPLKLALGGYHCHYCGENYEEGSIGYYWSSTIYRTVNDGNYSHYLHLGPASAGTDYNHRAYGYSVRCILD